jgi:hypothetical protein
MRACGRARGHVMPADGGCGRDSLPVASRGARVRAEDFS